MNDHGAINRRMFLRSAVGTGVGLVLAGNISSEIFASDKKKLSIGKDRLLAVLKAVGKSAKVIDGGNGTAIVVLPYGGRILGLFTAGSDENLLWTNPELSEEKTALSFFQSDGWKNIGGDRTWLAPEYDYFFPNYPNRSPYVMPPQFDPGNYQVVESSSSIKLSNEFTLRSYKDKKNLDLRIIKSFRSVANPLRLRSDELFNKLEYVGYSLTNTLELLNGGAEPASVGIWNILQLPHPGEMLIPTYFRTKPSIYFGEMPEGDLVLNDTMIRYSMTSKSELKLGVEALALTGRAGYVYSSGKRTILIIRNFLVNPSGEYIDVCYKRPADKGYAFHAVNIDQGLWSELEYHVPAIGGRTGLTRCDDTSEVWAFCGSNQDIKALTKKLFAVV
jgi:hypothetical protein